jgi:hypothetical protein
VSALDLTDRPDFPFRYLSDIQDRRPGQGKIPNTPREWVFRQKLLWSGEGRRMDHGHAWDEYLKPADWEAHPEWMAMDGSGKLWAPGGHGAGPTRESRRQGPVRPYLSPGGFSPLR